MHFLNLDFINSDLIYRDAQLSDLAGIVAIYNSTIASRVVTADLYEVTVEDRLAWFDEHSANKRPLWVVTNHMGCTIGWVSFQDFYSRAAYDATAEISIYLALEYRGKGYGMQILQQSIAACPSLAIKNLVGYIFAHNEASLQLFRKAGFEEWGHLPNIAILDGIERSVKILGRRIIETTGVV